MGKSTSVKREIRFQQWIQQVKEYNERPDGMSMSAWCLAHYLPVVRLSYHQISFFQEVTPIITEISVLSL